mgnify:CR=1 FL=1
MLAPVTFAPAPLAMLRSQPVSPGGYQKVVAPADAAVYFTNLRNGSTVASPVRVQFGLKGWGDAPSSGVGAGTVHTHLLVGVNLIDLAAARRAGVVVTNYLFRPLFPVLRSRQ